MSDKDFEAFYKPFAGTAEEIRKEFAQNAKPKVDEKEVQDLKKEMENITSIKKAWEMFLLETALKNAPTLQKNEMRKAYFTGAATMFHILTSVVVEGEPKVINQILDNLQNELLEFLTDLR